MSVSVVTVPVCWSWWCPWRWPLSDSTAVHQDRIHPAPLQMSCVESIWILIAVFPVASVSDTGALNTRAQRIRSKSRATWFGHTILWSYLDKYWEINCEKITSYYWCLDKRTKKALNTLKQKLTCSTDCAKTINLQRMPFLLSAKVCRNS